MESTKKTAISLPRALADRAERAARRRGIPRSRLYALALEAFLVDEQEGEEDDGRPGIEDPIVRPVAHAERAALHGQTRSISRLPKKP